MDYWIALRALQVDRDGAFVAIVGRKLPCSEAGRPSGWVSFGQLDIQDVGAKIYNYDAGTRPHDLVAKIEHFQTGKRGRPIRYAAFLLKAARLLERNAALVNSGPTMRSGEATCVDQGLIQASRNARLLAK